MEGAADWHSQGNHERNNDLLRNERPAEGSLCGLAARIDGFAKSWVSNRVFEREFCLKQAKAFGLRCMLGPGWR